HTAPIAPSAPRTISALTKYAGSWAAAKEPNAPSTSRTKSFLTRFLPLAMCPVSIRPVGHARATRSSCRLVADLCRTARTQAGGAIDDIGSYIVFPGAGRRHRSDGVGSRGQRWLREPRAGAGGRRFRLTGDADKPAGRRAT